MDELISKKTVLDALAEISREVDDGDGFDYAKWREYFCELPSAKLATDTNVGTKLGTNLAQLGTDCISRQQAIDDIWTVSPLARLDRKWVDRWLRQLPSAQPETIYCKDCKHWMPYEWMFSEVWQSQNIDDYPERREE